MCPGEWLGWSVEPYTKRLEVRFPIRTHTEAVGLIPAWGVYGRQLIDVTFSLLYFSLSHPLSQIKILKIYTCGRISFKVQQVFLKHPLVIRH